MGRIGAEMVPQMASKWPRKKAPNAPKIAPKWGPGGVPERPGGPRGARGGPEADPEKNREGPGPILGRFGGQLEGLWQASGGYFGLLWGSNFRCNFRCAPEAGLGPILGPKISPKGAPKEPERSFEAEGLKIQFLSNPPMFLAYF